MYGVERMLEMSLSGGGGRCDYLGVTVVFVGAGGIVDCRRGHSHVRGRRPLPSDTLLRAQRPGPGGSGARRGPSQHHTPAGCGQPPTTDAGAATANRLTHSTVYARAVGASRRPDLQRSRPYGRR